ncbi:hypothetical protein M8542_11280 [Amycolatopsis sp. OK19-0408]|uniref:Uncharacterized protein n=1 Tax=Amycolatopsis iheyensis TaxID=2945988 RepID=A0A9X2SK17_9PSEU|nr:hypothetical protein [Amycolatopsis iheyensis]MCR6483401.1 hypothetical protein [Amycolatopsis iheyensis]
MDDIPGHRRRRQRHTSAAASAAKVASSWPCSTSAISRTASFTEAYIGFLTPRLDLVLLSETAGTGAHAHWHPTSLKLATGAQEAHRAITRSPKRDPRP